MKIIFRRRSPLGDFPPKLPKFDLATRNLEMLIYISLAFSPAHSSVAAVVNYRKVSTGGFYAMEREFF